MMGNIPKSSGERSQVYTIRAAPYTMYNTTCCAHWGVVTYMFALPLGQYPLGVLPDKRHTPAQHVPKTSGDIKYREDKTMLLRMLGPCRFKTPPRSQSQTRPGGAWTSSPNNPGNAKLRDRPYRQRTCDRQYSERRSGSVYGARCRGAASHCGHAAAPPVVLAVLARTRLSLRRLRASRRPVARAVSGLARAI